MALAPCVLMIGCEALAAMRRIARDRELALASPSSEPTSTLASERQNA
jgi:hypothetical protein